jgi:hypothetical protein
MLKQYIAYLIVGILLARMASFSWTPNADVWRFVSLIAAVLLFTTASVLSLYKPKAGAILAIITLAGMFRFIWMMLRFMQFGHFPVVWMIDFIGYFVVLAISLIVIFKKDTTIPAVKLHKSMLRGLSIAPPMMLVVWMLLIAVLFGNFHIS